MANETKYPAKIHITDARLKSTSFLRYLRDDRGPALQKMPYKNYGDNSYHQTTTFRSTTASGTVLATINQHVTTTSKGNVRVSRKNIAMVELTFSDHKHKDFNSVIFFQS